MAGTRAAVFGVRPQTVRRGSDGKTDIYSWERALRRHGFDRIAGADEAGRGACAGPLVVGAVILPEGKRGVVPGLADSKLLTEAQREKAYAEITTRAIGWTAVVVPPQTVDRIGLHVANLSAMRQAISRLHPGFAVTDGFPVPGIPSPGLAMWKGDLVAACVAAASVIAKVTRDRIMVELDDIHPGYGFAAHKGYCTPDHQQALERLGPCVEHRFSYANVRAAAGLGQTAGMEVIG